MKCREISAWSLFFRWASTIALIARLISRLWRSSACFFFRARSACFCSSRRRSA
jgi:hypothetical protein